MKQFFWKEGRFGWGLIGAVVLFTLLFFITDYIWRMTPMSFNSFAIRALLINGMIMLGYIFIALRIGRKG